MVKVEMKVLGVEKLLQDLKKLPQKVQKRIMVGAVRAAAKPIVKEAKNLVPVEHEALKRSIGITRFKTRKKSLVWFQVSPRVEKYRLNAQEMKSGKSVVLTLQHSPYYGRFIEYGTYAKLDHPLENPPSGKRAKKRAAIVAKGGGISPKQRSYMRPAFEKEGENAIVAFKEYMAKRLDKELGR